jgi:hypothetical protein
MNGVTLSKTYQGVGPGASYFAGLPDLASGGVRNGWSWAWDGTVATGNLVFRAHYDSADGRDAITFDRLRQRIGMKSRTAYYGYLQHNATAEREWNFPDITGQVVVFSSGVPNGGGAAPTFGTIGGSGPTDAAQWGWGITYVEGTTFYVPLWR